MTVSLQVECGDKMFNRFPTSKRTVLVNHKKFNTIYSFFAKYRYTIAIILNAANSKRFTHNRSVILNHNNVNLGQTGSQIRGLLRKIERHAQQS